MSSVEAAEGAKVNGFQKQVLPLPVVEMELLLFYNYYCNNFLNYLSFFEVFLKHAYLLKAEKLLHFIRKQFF